MDTPKNDTESNPLSFPLIATAFACILAVLLIIGGIIIKKTARTSFEKDSHKELSQLTQNMKLEFDLGLSEQLVLALQMAKSPIIIKYFENPDDKSLQNEAFEEVLAYQNSFLSKLSFMINDKDLKYYANNEYLYTLNKNDETSSWYVGLIDSDQQYVFNVDYDIGLQQTFMWVNCIVRNSKNEFLGLIGTGIPISDFVNNLYSNLPENYTMYLYNNLLEITGSTDLHHLENKSQITEILPDLADSKDKLTKFEKQFIDIDQTVYGIEPIEDINWNIIIGIDYTVKAFFAKAIVPSSIMVVILVFVFLIFFIFLRLHLLHVNEQKIGSNILVEIQNLAVSAKENTATAQDQNTAVKEIVATMEDNNSLSENISTKIQEVSGIASKTNADVAEGVSYLEANVKQFNEISKANVNTIEGIKTLSDKITNIWDIVSLINSVADQAKIIAFNAELEASSAGEAGKNFHIVATEIRRLADGIIDGTKEIKEKINEIQECSDSLLLTSENGTEIIDVGVKSAKGLEERFASIKNASEITANSSNSITTIIKQQAVGSEQILMTLKQIASGVDNFSAATEEIARTSDSLRKIAENLTK